LFTMTFFGPSPAGSGSIGFLGRRFFGVVLEEPAVLAFWGADAGGVFSAEAPEVAGGVRSGAASVFCSDGGGAESGRDCEGGESAWGRGRMNPASAAGLLPGDEASSEHTPRIRARVMINSSARGTHGRLSEFYCSQDNSTNPGQYP